MREIGIDDLNCLLEGAALLGSGGGGSKKAGYDLIAHIVALKGQKPLQLLDPFDESFDWSTLACVVADVGANSAQEENQYSAIIDAFDGLSTQLKTEGAGALCAVAPIETGPENSVVPFVVAATRGLPVLNLDGAGRAVPILSLATFAALSPSPAIVTNSQGDAVLLQLRQVEDLDHMLRTITASDLFGDSGSLALWSGPASTLAHHGIKGTLGYAMACGCLLINKHKGLPIASALIDEVNARKGTLIARGVVQQVRNTATGGFDFTEVLIADDLTHSSIRILAQNESFILYSSTVAGPLVTAPTTIAYLTFAGLAITNAEVKEGDQLFVIAIAAREELLKPAFLPLFGKQLEGFAYFGDLMHAFPGEQPLGDLLMQLA